MRSRSFIILFTAVLLMVALLYTQRQDPQQDQQQLILPGLSGVLNDVERVTVIGAGNSSVATMVRDDDYWILEERDGYRADVGRIRRNLIALANAKVVEPKTTDPALHPRLGVEDLGSPDAAGKQFVIAAPGQTFSLIVGNTGVRGGMAYVRKPDAAQSFLVSADLDPGDGTTDWLATNLLSVDAGRIYSVTTAHADGETLRVEKATRDATAYTLVEMPDGRELQYATILDTVPSLLTDLTFDDVGKRDPSKELEVVASTRFETFDGLIVEATIFDAEDGRRVTFEASADENLSALFTGPENGDGVAGDQLSFAAVRDEADTLNAQLAGWIYTLPSFKVDQLARRTEDLLKPLD